MKNRISLAIILLNLLGLMSCSNHVDFGEQYKKIIFIVNANDEVFTHQHRISDTIQDMFVSLYCSGTIAPQENIPVILQLDSVAMAAYNKKSFDESNYYKHLVMLPAPYYEIPSWQGIIHAGEVYGKFPIRLKTRNWDPDSNYVIPLSIQSVPEAYEVNPKLKTIYYQVELINDYSGDFTGLCMYIKNGKETYISKDKKLKAIDVNQLRLAIYNLSDENKDLEDHFMVLTVLPDLKVRITPWKNAFVTDLGGSSYDPINKQFVLHYECLDASGNTVEIEETLKNTALVNDEDENAE